MTWTLNITSVSTDLIDNGIMHHPLAVGAAWRQHVGGVAHEQGHLLLACTAAGFKCEEGDLVLNFAIEKESLLLACNDAGTKGDY